MPILSVERLSVSYGSIRAVKDVSFQVHEGEIVTLLGANGAGKSTIMRTILGLQAPDEGRILYNGQDIRRQDTRHRVAGGITLVPEGRHVFPKFSVRDNLLLGAYTERSGKGKYSIHDIYELFPRLKEREDQPAGTLSGGEQQMLAVGRAMMASPKLLLLDEPSLGLAPLIVRDILNLVKTIRDMGTTILLVEQNARSALRISDRGYVLETGKIVMEDTADALLASEQVQKVYLGM
jgi:branched-chain amino acid transport system ATP-binding protein